MKLVTLPLSLVILLIACAMNAAPVLPSPSTASGATDTGTGNLLGSFGTGNKTITISATGNLTASANSTATFSGILQGTPQSGALNLSNLTLTLPGTYLTAAQVAAAYQPLDSDLTAIAALTTTANGRSLLTASSLTAAGLGLTNGTTIDNLVAVGSNGILQRTAANTYGVASYTGLTWSVGVLSVNASQAITTLSALTSNGPIYTSGGTGALNVGTTTGTGTTYVLSASPTISGALGVGVAPASFFRNDATLEIAGPGSGHAMVNIYQPLKTDESTLNFSAAIDSGVQKNTGSFSYISDNTTSGSGYSHGRISAYAAGWATQGVPINFWSDSVTLFDAAGGAATRPGANILFLNSSAAAIWLGNNTTALYSPTAGRVALNHIGGTAPVFFWEAGGVDRLAIETSGVDAYISTKTAGASIFIRPDNATLAATFTSTATTLAGNLIVGGSIASQASTVLAFAGGANSGGTGYFRSSTVGGVISTGGIGTAGTFARADAGFEAQGNNVNSTGLGPMFSLFNTVTSAQAVAAGGNQTIAYMEEALCASALDTAGATQKVGAISFGWGTVPTPGSASGYGIVRLQASGTSGADNNVIGVMYGNLGVRFLGGNVITSPGAGVFALDGATFIHNSNALAADIIDRTYRNSNSFSGAHEWYTNNAKEWALGEQGGFSSSDFYLYAFSPIVRVAAFSKSDGSLTLSSTVEATIGGAGSLTAAGIYASKKVITASTFTSAAGVAYDFGASSATTITSANKSIKFTVAGTDFYVPAKLTND